MRYRAIDEFRAAIRAAPPKGPVAAVIAEDDREVESTLAHLARAGFAERVLLAPPELTLPDDAGHTRRIDARTLAVDATETLVNSLIAALPEGTWLHYCYNAEYLFYPFAETRSVGEMLTFHAEERRDAMLTYVVDLYADDLTRSHDAVDRDRAHLDRSGYYALARGDGSRDRQLDFFGGLRWRFEEHIPETRRRIDRIGLFRVRPGLRFRPDHTLSDEEMNTFACPWHNNLTAAIVSFRTAKALRINPATRYGIDTFLWSGSVPFEWSSRQLMDLGLMEPGQWF